MIDTIVVTDLELWLQVEDAFAPVGRLCVERRGRLVLPWKRLRLHVEQNPLRLVGDTVTWPTPLPVQRTTRATHARAVFRFAGQDFDLRTPLRPPVGLSAVDSLSITYCCRIETPT